MKLDTATRNHKPNSNSIDISNDRCDVELTHCLDEELVATSKPSSNSPHVHSPSSHNQILVDITDTPSSDPVTLDSLLQYIYIRKYKRAKTMNFEWSEDTVSKYRTKS